MSHHIDTATARVPGPHASKLKTHRREENHGRIRSPRAGQRYRRQVLIETESDRILGFTMFGAGAGDVTAAVQMAMLAGMPYNAVSDAVIAHPTMPEGLTLLFGNVPPKEGR
jgi:pyruvate/2-oxoglutarate dehydrogenase complex dihydrolipoamide dehydrogenase (E3) component